MRRTTLLALAMTPVFACAQVTYHVQVPAADSKILRITVSFPVKSGKETLATTNWAPGSYVLSDTYKKITNFKVVDEQGREKLWSQPQPYKWEIETNGAKTLTATYEIPFSAGSNIGHFSGPGSYMYVWDRKTEPCKLTLDLPKGWKIAVGLNNAGASNVFSAPTYDVLADNPVTVGDFIEDHYTVRGKDHTIVLYGPSRQLIKRPDLIEKCKKITETEANFFGGLPYDKYVWHFSTFNAPDGAGGLEHLSSTEISLASGLGPGAVSVLSHEFFHLWNVKRIRSYALGPFDYTQLPRTAALWWLEGVTDYYAHWVIVSNGMWTRDQFYDTTVRQWQSVSTNPAFKEVGPAKSSYFVRWENNMRGNSNGYKLSYYELGYLTGLLLDIELRDRTAGKYSLHNVEWALWDLCKDDQPGFGEYEIRNQLVRFGGEGMGDYYDKMVAGGGMPYFQETLAKAGLSLANKKESILGYNFSLRPTGDQTGVTIRRGNLDGVMPFDRLVSINGKLFADLAKQKDIDQVGLVSASGDLLKAEMGREEQNGAGVLVVLRQGKEVSIPIPPKGQRYQMRTKLVEDNDPAHTKLRDALFAPVKRG